jgi:hypothetical protein
MIVPSNSHVKILLKCNLLIEGIVQPGDDDTVITLLSLDNTNKFIIPRPKEDIVVIKVLLNKAPDAEAPPPKIIVPEKNTETTSTTKIKLEKDFDEVYKKPSADVLRTKTLAELRILMGNEDRQILINKLRSHHAGDLKKVKYDYPKFFKKSST